MFGGVVKKRGGDGTVWQRREKKLNFTQKKKRKESRKGGHLSHQLHFKSTCLPALIHRASQMKVRSPFQWHPGVLIDYFWKMISAGYLPRGTEKSSEFLR